MTPSKVKIAIIGCGNMGAAIAKKLSETAQIRLYDHSFDKVQQLEKEGAGTACKELKDAVQQSTIIILAVKPKNLNEIAEELRPLLSQQLIISILSSTSRSSLKKTFPGLQILRTMPNLALKCGEGVIGLVNDPELTDENRQLATQLLETLGFLCWVPEEKINALTAIAGSGPAFFLVMIESMVEAGIAMGFNAQDAMKLALKMASGSIALLQKQGCHPGELKWQITSPGGTTIAGIKQLEECGLRNAVIKTFIAAFDHTESAESSGK